MHNYKIEIEGKKTYIHRLGYSIFWVSFVITPICLVVLHYVKKDNLSLNANIGLYIFLVLVEWYYFDKFNAYYITFFEIKEGKVHIKYYYGKKRMEVEDKIENFKFTKEKPTLFIPVPTPKIEVEHKGEFLLSNYQGWEWKDNISKLQDYLRQNKLLSDED